MITKDDIKVGAKFHKNWENFYIVTKIREDGRITVSTCNGHTYWSSRCALALFLNQDQFKIMNPEPNSEIIEIEHKGRKIKFNLTAAEKAGIVEVEPKIKIYDGVKYKDLLGNHFSFSEYADEWFRIKGGKITNCIGNLSALKNFIEHNSYILVEE